MEAQFIENFNLKQIAESGQCFRWKQLDEEGKEYRIIAGSKFLEVKQIRENYFSFSCEFPEYFCIWRDYFDTFTTDYKQIIEKAKKAGGLLADAAEAGSGIRILQQDPWEILITFLIAQNISIQRATTLIEKLCSEYGQKMRYGKIEYNAFPRPDDLATASPEDLRRLGFGYRDKQIITAARIVASGAADIYMLKRLNHDTAKLILKNIHGVGDKVAECICLFGLGQHESYPIDTWINKIEDYFGHGYIQSEFPDHAGIVQQYLFSYVRQHGLPGKEAP